ncbi:hypothetical protein [Dongia sedimenti]|uniref:Sulphur transport domain-containing protein n=1 Tax=Dongia sedimenti TaxID=3064282 RepID=A0ABU0YJE8_9PROT|nr:hypothetical protein [Rhodospirillaceae bacterium R-7]
MESIFNLITSGYGAAGVAVLALFTALWFVIKNLNSLLKVWDDYAYLVFETLGIRPCRLILLGIAFGAFSSVIGGLAYILVPLNPGAPTWPPPDDWQAAHQAPWVVKLWRTTFFGAAIGSVLSVLMTVSAKAIGRLSASKESYTQFRYVALVVPVGIVALAAASVLVGGKMSQTGEIIASFKNGIFGSFSGGHYDAMTNTSFGSGTCKNLAEYKATTANPATGNNFCDVGPIASPYIVLSVTIFVSLWMLMLYWATLKRDTKKTLAIRKRLIRRIALHAVISTSFIVGIAVYLEPWEAPVIAEGRELLLRSPAGFTVLVSLCVAASISGLLVAAKDVGSLLLPQKRSKNGPRLRC